MFFCLDEADPKRNWFACLGVVVGPYGLSLVDDLESVELLAEIGVVVLLFTVGLEISLSRLLAMLPLMVSIGLPQIAGTTLLIAAPVDGMWEHFLKQFLQGC